jgi:hypothetical protein
MRNTSAGFLATMAAAVAMGVGGCSNQRPLTPEEREGLLAPNNVTPSVPLTFQVAYTYGNSGGYYGRQRQAQITIDPTVFAYTRPDGKIAVEVIEPHTPVQLNNGGYYNSGPIYNNTPWSGTSVLIEDPNQAVALVVQEAQKAQDRAYFLERTTDRGGENQQIWLVTVNYKSGFDPQTRSNQIHFSEQILLTNADAAAIEAQRATALTAIAQQLSGNPGLLYNNQILQTPAGQKIYGGSGTSLPMPVQIIRNGNGNGGRQ